MKNGFATLEQVKQCLEEQKARYQARKRVPTMSDVMLRHGFVTEAQDAAITQAMGDLDIEEMVARRPGAAPAAAPAQAEALPEELEVAAGGGEDRVAFDAISEDFERVASEPEVPAILEEEEDEDAGGAGGPAASDEEVLEDAAVEAAPQVRDALAAVSEAAAQAHADPGGDPGAREMETRDEIDALLRPDDLELEGAQVHEEAEQALESDEEALALPEAFAARKPAKPTPPPFEGIGDIEGADEALEVFSDSEDTVLTPAAAPAIAVGIDVTVCPECKVELSAGTTECLYCGHRFVSGPTSNDITDEVLLEGEELEPLTAVGGEAPSEGEPEGEASAGAAEAKLDAPAVREQPFAEAFSQVDERAVCPRGRLLRARSAEGRWHWVWRLPEGLMPSEEQIEAYLADAKALAEAELRHFVPLRWIGRDAEGVYAVYADAPGEPAPAQVAGGPLDRMRSARIIKHLACACRDAAEAGVLPREFRPEGVLIEDGEEAMPRVVGYGLMRLVEPPAKGASEPDPDDAFVPPERRRKPDRADVRTGIYGLGALLVLLLTGEPPSGEQPEVPGAMRSFLNKTLSRATGKRYLDFSKVFIDVDRFPGARGLEVQTR